MKLLILLSVLAASAIASQKRYDGEIYDFWTDLRTIGHSTDIMVPPAYVSLFVDLMHAYSMEYRVKMVNVQTVLDMARDEQVAVPRFGSPRYSVTWDNYYDFNAITAFINGIAAAHPDKVPQYDPTHPNTIRNQCWPRFSQ